MTFVCPSCEGNIKLSPGGRPNVRSQVLAHLSDCIGTLPASEVVDWHTEYAFRTVKKPALHCLRCDDICTVHGEDDNVAFCSDLE